MRAILPAAALAGVLLLTGCGIKGPLYHPDPAKTRPAPATQTQGGADNIKPTPPTTQ
ncbi:LPS translocon maturation chaperone LptM [Azoarcus olearius]|uniref:Conserved hypothetical secreted protein n=1 Tax=Azoarcus sp. (strain BH72) TaxID=418699 RepID=A1KBR3_AZOSB|nr:lipoprotein [Azoarcus olearius]ANQ86815.1 hypothetical protein dqs_3798 [Azoarcus olearius]CAL96269.1 conserved hypothetical secreted protein [Azoarcus olearius]